MADIQLKRTKIVCTLGPASWDPKTLKQLAEAGMNVARLNFSHGTQEEKADQIANIRRISKEIGKPIAILADLQGPKIRLGMIDGVRNIKKGDKIVLSLNPVEEELPMQYDLSPFVKKGQRIFLNDGLVEIKVDEVKGKTIHTTAQNDGWVSSNKGVNVPDTRMKGASFTPKDRSDAEFALSQDVDYLAISFVQTPEDLKDPKELIKKHKSRTKIVVKVEKNEAITYLEEIIKETDAVMVARGDLAIETAAAQVPVHQQKMIRLSRQYQKPVIVATQMLESMTENPRPTRAEVSDVANAVLDQVDAVMLSAESASGKYPVETVTTMKDVILSVERNMDYARYFKINWETLNSDDVEVNAIAAAAASLAYRTHAKAIVVATATGRTAKILSSFRPVSPIVAVTHDETTCNQLVLNWGIKSVVVPATDSPTKFWDNMIEEVKKQGFAKKGDQVVLISGTNVGLPANTDTIKLVTL